MKQLPLEKLPPVKAYLKRVGAQMTSIFRATVSEKRDRYNKEIYVIRFNRSGEVFAPAAIQPTPAELEAIADSIAKSSLPEPTTLSALPLSGLPPDVASASEQDLFILRNLAGEIVMLQHRVDKTDGSKRYIPWTFWSDGEWYQAEPEGPLPLYGIETAKDSSRVFIHEGAKAARAAQKIAEGSNHPWKDYLATGKHVGWIGGVHQVRRANWREIKAINPDDIIIMSDNDMPSIMTVPVIARQFTCMVGQVRYDDSWPNSWDVADPLPEDKFEGDFWVGPELRELITSAEWATDVIPQEHGRPVVAIRKSFASKWIRIDRTKQYAHIARPDLAYDREGFNNTVAQFSDSRDTAGLLAKTNHTRAYAPTFRPGGIGPIVRENGLLYVNQYVDRRVKPKFGMSTDIFHEFLEYLFPDDEDRDEFYRWCATLYACPEIRMGYGILVLSRRQGVGKSTLGVMLARMIGMPHCSFPGDSMITQSDFNGWAVSKRLVVVHEIYAGQNWRAYNKLKALITDEEIEANIKFQPTYTLPNCCHFYCCSNSMEALRIERDDRRWFVPGVIENLWLKKKYNELWHWIRRGGLHSLALEFNNFDNFVSPGEPAPVSTSKDALIDASRPEDEVLLHLLLDQLQANEAMIANDVWLWMRDHFKGRMFLSPQRCAHVAKALGFGVSERRIRVTGVEVNRKQRLIAIDQETADRFTEEDSKKIMGKLVTPDTIYERGRML